jgi:prophage regulatory protein
MQDIKATKMSEDKYLRVKQVCERTGLSRPTIYNMMKAGTFPMKTALGERAVAWLESEILTWMEARKTFEKSGLEAKPGRPPTSTKVKKTTQPRANSLVEVTAPIPQAAPLTAASECDDWGQNEPTPTESEMNETRSNLVRLNQPKNTFIKPLKANKRPESLRPRIIKI